MSLKHQNSGITMKEGLFAFIVIGVFLFTLAFSYLFVNYYLSDKQRSAATVIFCTLAISASLIALLLVPADVYSVSGDLTSTGHARNPSEVNRAADALKHLYYIFYFVIIFLAFIIMPFLYFYFEERNEEDTKAKNLWRATRYTLVFVVVFAVLIGISFLIKKKHVGGGDDGDWRNRIAQDFSNLDQLLTFTISCLAFLGLILFCYYVGYGLAMVPFSLLRSQVVTYDNERQDLLDKRAKLESDLNQQDEEVSYNRLSSSTKAGTGSSSLFPDVESAGNRNSTSARLAEYRAKRANRDDPSFRQVQTERLTAERKLKENTEQLNRIEAMDTRPQRCRKCLSVISFPMGILAMLLSLLIVLQIILSLVDRFKNSPCKLSCGYTLSKPSLPNPVDRFLVVLSKVAPIDTGFYTVFIIYMFICCISGLVALGSRLLCLKMYDIRPKATPANGFIFACWFLMFMGLVLNLQTQSIAPHYTTFGQQFYLVNPPDNVLEAPSPSVSQRLLSLATSEYVTNSYNSLSAIEAKPQKKECTIERFELNGTCRLTQISLFIQKSNNQLPFFGGAQFFSNLILILVFVVSFIYAIFRSKESWHGPATQTVDPDAPNYVSSQRRR